MTAVNLLDNRASGAESPASRAETVTPSDTVDLVTVSRGLYVGVAGNVAVVMLGGSTQTFVGVQAGSILPVRVTRVMATNTTATNMIALN